MIKYFFCVLFFFTKFIHIMFFPFIHITYGKQFLLLFEC